MANKNNQGTLDANEVLQSSEAFFFKNKKVIIAAVAVVVLILVGIFSYKSLISGPREEKASMVMVQVMLDLRKYPTIIVVPMLAI